jgi:hypothetical protein
VKADDLDARARETIAALVRLDRALGCKPERRSAASMREIVGAWASALPHVAAAVDTLGVVGSLRAFRCAAKHSGRVLAEGGAS